MNTKVSIYSTGHYSLDTDGVAYKILKTEFNESSEIKCRSYLNASGEWMIVDIGQKIPEECIFFYPDDEK